jgi:hypothetical protein
MVTSSPTMRRLIEQMSNTPMRRFRLSSVGGGTVRRDCSTSIIVKIL